jgi:hypothetical protein
MRTEILQIWVNPLRQRIASEWVIGVGVEIPLRSRGSLIHGMEREKAREAWKFFPVRRVLPQTCR